MNLLEQMIPRALASEYFEVSLEKAASEQWPSVSRCSRA